MATTGPSISADSWARFMALRDDLFAAIQWALEQDGHCKSYEGTFTVLFGLPNYFEREEERRDWGITLGCYVIGPSRHYEWFGATFEEALAKAEADVRKWIVDERRLRLEQ